MSLENLDLFKVRLKLHQILPSMQMFSISTLGKIYTCILAICSKKSKIELNIKCCYFHCWFVAQLWLETDSIRIGYFLKNRILNFIEPLTYQCVPGQRWSAASPIPPDLWTEELLDTCQSSISTYSPRALTGKQTNLFLCAYSSLPPQTGLADEWLHRCLRSHRELSLITSH